MKINKSGASYSSIVKISELIKKTEKETGIKFLTTQRGINDVVGINLDKIKDLIDFNSKEYQIYSPNKGSETLRKNITLEYFPNHPEYFNYTTICAGGMNALDILFQTISTKTIYFNNFSWGSYYKISKIRNKDYSFYNTLDDIDTSKLNDEICIVICDPANPTGIKINDDYLKYKINEITNTGAIIIMDSPYRKLFYNDNFFEEIMCPNLILCESFSKWIGLPGSRISFITTLNEELNDELNIRLLYELNSVSSPSQILVNTILSTTEGKKAIQDFQSETKKHIKLNIDYLKKNNLLVDEIYNGHNPMGIFAIINKSEDFLFQHRIGAVGLDKFVYYEKDSWSSYSRICVSVNHELFKAFISNII
jgi:aspartate aminotransferase